MFLRKTAFPALFLVLFAAVAAAETDTFISTADADIWEYLPDNNRGSKQYFQVGCCSSGFHRNSLVEFDLVPISGTTVHSAVVRLMVADAWGDFPTDEIFIARNGSAWDEMTVTWNSQPAITDTKPIGAPSSLGWWEIDVTLWVQNMVFGILPNHGFHIFQDDRDYAGFTMRTKEGTMPPELVVDYTPLNLQGITFGSIKALFR